MPEAKTAPPPRLRTATNTDAPGIIDLVGRCYAEYPGCVLDVDGEEPELLDPEGAFSAFWVLDRGGEVVGTIGCKIQPAGDGRKLELKKLYLHPDVRGAGWARKLVALIEGYARRHDIGVVELWTDTRFENAHGLYAHLGYTRTGKTRELHDKSNTVEYYFVKELSR
ncbi:MAG: GNAT family N-acetyltransferase [Planctomycetota bacterium]|jgi:putative acetyltransferase